MTSRALLMPQAEEKSAAAYPALMKVGGRWVLAFDAATPETGAWTLVVPQGWVGPGKIVAKYMMASAITGGVALSAAVEANTPGDALDLDAATSFDTANVATDSAVPGTAGYEEEIEIPLTNSDGLAAGDVIVIRLTRETANAADTATGDMYVRAVELRDAA